MITGEDRLELLREKAETPDGAWVTCASPSMVPTIRVGQRVRIGARPVRVGDVVLFESVDRASLVLHRVVMAPSAMSWIAHVGDASSPLATAVFHRRRLVGVATEIPRTRPSAASRAVAGLRLARRALCGDSVKRTSD